MEKLHNSGLIIQGCFILGLDQDTKAVFHDTLDAVNDLRIDIPRFAIFTPYPETKAFCRLKAEGRILHEYWPHYDTQHVVYQPAQMSPSELDSGFRSLYKQAFSLSSIGQRLVGSTHAPITFVGNLAYRLYIRRLQCDAERLRVTKEREGPGCQT